MSLDKSIQFRKQHRKPYRGAKSIDATCRNHGSCSWCQENRIHKNEKRELAMDQRLKEFNQGTCKWRDDFTWICFNGDSEMCADVVDDDYCRECRLFEVKENE
jgi:hypothetical protein